MLFNRAAAYLEKGDFEECAKDCDTAIEKGRELRADYKLVARAMSRKGIMRFFLLLFFNFLNQCIVKIKMVFYHRYKIPWLVFSYLFRTLFNFLLKHSTFP